MMIALLAQILLPFTLAPDSFKVGICGDSQGNNYNVFGQHCQNMAAEGISLFIGLGDHVQNGGAAEWQAQWTAPLAPLASLPRFSCRGNHDPIQEFSQFVWSIPQHALTSPYGNAIGCWGAVTFGPCWFWFSDTNETPAIAESLLEGGSQLRDVRAALASTDCRRARWRIAAFHQPLATECWDGGCYYPQRPERALLMDTLAQAGVHAILNGHAHAYQRGAYRDVPWIISGGGGGWLDTTHCQDIPEIQVAQAIWHHLLMTVTPDSLTVEAKDLQGHTFDQIVIR